VDAGASMSTHLGNGSHANLQRHPNYVWDQLAEDRLVASLIADGHHLPPAVVKCLVRAKSPERVILISDVTGLASHSGTEPGQYTDSCLGAVEVLDDGRVVVAGQRDYLAGAIQPLRVGVANVMRFAQVDLATAINMASIRPAEMLGLQQDRFASGTKADLIQFEMSESEHASIRILATFNAGQCVYGEPTAM
jgi:N-acetylglucosamine-6-phosphate deacetylase